MLCKDCRHYHGVRYTIDGQTHNKRMCIIKDSLDLDFYHITECSQFKEKKEDLDKTIAVKTPAILIDELFTVLHKCWNQQEIVMNIDNSIDAIAEASIKAQELNAKRNRLIRALDEVLGYKEVTLTEKTYDKEK